MSRNAFLLILSLFLCKALPAQQAFLLVDKPNFTLSVIDSTGYIEKTYGIGCGIHYGNKQRRGDHKTPEGTFRINEILYAANISHDFGDGKGPIPGAYGPWFLRLDTPQSNVIGIHGTHLPASIGTRCSEGCIRMRNEDVTELKERVYLGFTVIILPDAEPAPDPGIARDSCRYDLFLCYGEKSRALADSLRQELEAEGLRVAPDTGERSFFPTPETKRAIADSRYVLVIPAPDARQAVAVLGETRYARTLQPGPDIIQLGLPALTEQDWLAHYTLEPGALLPWLRIRLHGARPAAISSNK